MRARPVSSLLSRLCAAPSAAEVAQAGLTNLRRLCLLLTVSLAWSFALAPAALAATPQAQAPERSFGKPFTAEQVKQTLAEIEQRRLRQEAATRGMQQALARSAAALARAAARSRPRTPSVTLLDQNGRLGRPVDPYQVGLWKHELKTTHPAARRAAALHVWLGEWALAANEQPAQARWHFAQAERLTPRTDGLHGLAAYDAGISFYVGGAYADAADAFHRLLLPRTALPGYSRPLCALWWRHAAACDGYHQAHARLGIPEPPALDPLCGAAALAASLRALRMPSDRRTVLRSCRVTGEGSSLADLVAAGPGLGVHVRSVTATDQGLMALPKPVVAYVEQDHFVSVVRADKSGVSYLCSDCGPWPGGRVDLTWAQWHALSPGVYATVTRPGSRWDLALTSLGGVRVSSLPDAGHGLTRPRHVAPLVPALPALRGVSILQNTPTYYQCGGRYVCLIEACYVGTPKLSPKSTSGPIKGEPVDLTTGEEDYAPDADMTVYNPVGPSVSFGRVYNSMDDPTDTEGGSPGFYTGFDFGCGWSQTYGVGVGFDTVCMSDGSTIPFTQPSQSPTAGHPVTCPVGPGVPLVIQCNYGASGDYYTVTFPDRTTWVMTSQQYTVDGYEELAQIVDRNGNAITFHYSSTPYYNKANALTSITNSAGTTLLTITRGSSDLITSVSDCYGRSVYYQSAAFNNYQEWGYELTGVSQIVPTGTANAVANYGHYVYGYKDITNPEGEPEFLMNTITVPSPTGSATSTATINYDSSDQVKSVQDGNGNTATIDYLSGTSTQVTWSGGTPYTYTVGYDGQMTQSSQTDGAGHATYTVNGFSPADPYEPAAATDGNGRTTSYTWDAYGNLLTETPPTVSGERTPAVTTNAYNYTNFALGELTQTQEGSKTPTSYAYYEPSGLVKTVTGPQPGTAGAAPILLDSFAYDGLGNVTSVTKPGPNSTPAATTASSGFSTYVTTALDYTADGSYSQGDALGQPLTVTDPLGHTTHYRYDARGNTTATVDALGNETDSTFNIDDRPLSTIYPATGQSGSGRGSTLDTYLYNGPGPGQQYGPLVSVQTFDEGDTGGAFRTVSYAHGPEGELRGVSGSVEPVTYTYDELYRLTSLADGNQNVTHYFYNAQGYLSQVAYPGAGSPASPLAAGTRDTVSYTAYDGAGDVLTRVDGNGTTTTYAYQDPQSLLTDVHYAPGSGVSALADTAYTYDPYGRRAAMADATGQQAYAYDDGDRLTADTTTYTGLAAKAITYAFDPDGSRASMATPGGSFTYGYDSAGRMTTLGDSYGETYSWAYLANDWLQSQQLFDGTTTAYTYNARGQMTDLLNQGNREGDTEFAAPAKGGYDGAGNLTALSASASGTPASGTLGGQTTYAYDGRNELTGETSTRNGGYSSANGYDGAENPTTLAGAAHGYNQDNQDTAYGYDGDGATATVVVQYANTAYTTYDPEGRLAGLYGSVSARNRGSSEWSAAYNGDGLRAYSGANSTGINPAYYLYDGDRPVVELNSSGAVAAVNIFGANGLLARHTPANPGSYATDGYVFDMAGSVVGGTDVPGNVYTGFGQSVTGSAGEDVCWGWGAQWGAYTDQGYFVLCTHRYYDPATERFLTRDPIGYNGGVNLYAYTQNNPVNRSDPEGTTFALPFPVTLPTLGDILNGIRTGIGGIVEAGGGVGVAGTIGLTGVLTLGLATPAGPTSEFPVKGGISGAMGDNANENALTDRIAAELGLTAEEARELHDLITGQHLTPAEIWQAALDIINNRGSNNLGRCRRGGRGPGGRGKGRDHG